MFTLLLPHFCIHEGRAEHHRLRGDSPERSHAHGHVVGEAGGALRRRSNAWGEAEGSSKYLDPSLDVRERDISPGRALQVRVCRETYHQKGG